MHLTKPSADQGRQCPLLSIPDTVDLNQLKTVQKRLKKESSGSGRRLKYGSLAKQDSGAAGSLQTEVVIGAKDTTCFLFHALGKILYFKSKIQTHEMFKITLFIRTETQSANSSRHWTGKQHTSTKNRYVF